MLPIPLDIPLATVQPGTSAVGGLTLAGGWASIAMIVMGLALVAMVLLHLRNVRRGGVAKKPAGAHSDVVADLPSPQLALELEGLSRRLADELDSRADRLEKLIADADDRLARLERLTASIVHASPETAHGLAEVKHFGACGGGTGPTGDQAVRSAAAVIAEIDPIALEVYQLADGGLPPVQIAQRLGQHTGKVELILALRRA